MVKSRKELDDFKKSFKESLEFWCKSLNEDLNNIFNEIAAAKVENPMEEFAKVTKLIKAHTTKVGIIFKPDNLKNDDVSAAFTTLENLSNSSKLLVTLYSQLRQKQISQLLRNDIKLSLIQLYVSLVRLLDELNVEYAEQASTNDSDGRLKSVGIVWSNCDSLISLIDNGEIGALTMKIKSNIGLIEDGFEEFVEWVENPVDFNDDDPFGLEFSEEEDLDDEIDGTEDSSPPAMNGDAKDRTELIAFCKLWIKQIELIKLLLASFKKSLPVTTSGLIIDQVNVIQRELVVLIDKFISDIMMDQLIDDDIKQYTTMITKNGLKLSTIAQECHKLNDKKVKWYQTWSSKYESNLK